MVNTRGGKKRIPTRRSPRGKNSTAAKDSSIEDATVVTQADPSEAEAVARLSEPAMEEDTEAVPQPKRKRKRKKKDDYDEDIEEDREPISGDDCEVVDDEDCEADCDDDFEVGVENLDCEPVGDALVCVVPAVDGVEDRDKREVAIEEENCEDFEAEFGPEARDENGDENGDQSDADSGDDIWDDDRIPDPLSRSDDEDESGDEDAAPQAENPEEFLRLGKTFNGPEEFKIAVLRYSLKTRYDVTLYKSQSLRVGAKCSATDVKCPWRCFCSYEKRKHKMQVKKLKVCYADGLCGVNGMNL